MLAMLSPWLVMKVFWRHARSGGQEWEAVRLLAFLYSTRPLTVCALIQLHIELSDNGCTTITPRIVFRVLFSSCLCLRLLFDRLMD